MADSLANLLPGEKRIVDALTIKMDTWKAELLAELHAKEEKIESSTNYKSKDGSSQGSQAQGIHALW